MESGNGMKEFVQKVTGDLGADALARVVRVLLVAVILLIAVKVVRRLTDRLLERLHMEATLKRFLRSALHVVLYFVAILMLASAMGLHVTSLVALASVVSAAFALAASNSLSNLFGGLLMLGTKPFVVGDFVKIGDQEGTVREIGLLNTTLDTLDNKRITMPNGTIAGSTVVNCTAEGKRRVDLDFSVDDTVSMEQVKTLIGDVARRHPMVLPEEELFIRVSAFGERCTVYTLRAWCATGDYWTVYHDLLEQVRAALDQAGIALSYQNLQIYAGNREKRDGV